MCGLGARAVHPSVKTARELIRQGSRGPRAVALLDFLAGYESPKRREYYSRTGRIFSSLAGAARQVYERPPLQGRLGCGRTTVHGTEMVGLFTIYAVTQAVRGPPRAQEDHICKLYRQYGAAAESTALAFEFEREFECM